MVKTPGDRLGYGEDKKPSSDCNDLGVDQGRSPALAPAHDGGGIGGLGNGSVLGLGVSCPGQDPAHPRVHPPGRLDAGQGNRCSSFDDLLNCQGPEDSGLGGRKA